MQRNGLDSHLLVESGNVYASLERCRYLDKVEPRMMVQSGSGANMLEKVREEIKMLQKLGKLPDSNASEEEIERYAILIEKITPSVTDEEAKILVRLFGPDECYGLAWSLVHLIETAPGWPIWECLQNDEDEWVKRLKKAALNSLNDRFSDPQNL
jgi:hypothetical protein